MIINYRKFFLAIVAIVGVFFAAPVDAVNYLLDGIPCIGTGLCTPCDLIQVGVNGTEIILGLSGVVMLLIFIYGGFMWMISYGDSKKIETGSSAIKAAVIGMVLVFISYFVVELLWQAFLGNKPFSNSTSCTPLNIESSGYLGNSKTGGGQGGTEANGNASEGSTTTPTTTASTTPTTTPSAPTTTASTTPTTTPSAPTTTASTTPTTTPSAPTTTASTTPTTTPSAPTTTASTTTSSTTPTPEETPTNDDYGCDICNKYKVHCCYESDPDCDTNYLCDSVDVSIPDDDDDYSDYGEKE